MLMPKRLKFRKYHRYRTKGKASRGNTICFGEYALQAIEPGRFTSNQIEAARVAIVRGLRKGGKLWIRIFPDHPYTKKPLETRMGKGKGNIEGYEAIIKPGKILFEVGGVPEELAVEALKQAQYKIPFKTRIIKREILGEE